MRRSRRTPSRLTTVVAGAALLLLPVPGGTAPAPTRPVGVNAAVRNQVRIRSAGTQQLHPALLRAAVMLNDEVRTGPASLLQILLLDRSTFTVGANASVAVDRFAFDPATNARATAISVARGAFRFMSGRALGHPSGPAQVRTPIASIGIRGTIFEGAVGPDAIALAARQPRLAAMRLHADPNTATFVVLRGPGPQTQGDTTAGAIDVSAGGKTVTLDRPGMAVFVPRAGATPIGPFAITRDALALLQPLLRTVPPASAVAAGALAGSGGRGGGGGSLPGGGTAPRGDGGRTGFPGLLAGAITAIVLGLISLGAGSDDALPASP